MTDLDDELRLALRREEPPPDFAARVLDSLPGERPANAGPAWRRRAPLRTLAAAAVVLATLAGWWLAAPRRSAEVSPPQLVERDPGHAPAGVDSGPGGVRRGEEDLPPGPEVKVSYAPRAHPRAPRTPARRVRPAATDGDSARAETARDQLVQALRITGAKINLAQRRIHEMHREPQS